MANRDLANCIDSPIAQVVHQGAKLMKENVRKTIPDNLGIMYDHRTFWIHDMEFYNSAYNCIGLNPSQLLANETLSTFSSACRALFRSIIALTNQQSGGIGFIDFDTDMAQYVFQETDSDLENDLWQLLMDLNTYVRKGCEMAYVTFNFGLCTTENGRRITKALLSAYSRNQLIFPNMVFKVKNKVNRYPEDPNFDLYCLASKVTAFCMNPTYLNMDTSFNSCIPSEKLGIMGCRTRVAVNRFHRDSSLNRGNIAAVTINLVQLALESGHDTSRFYSLLFDVMDKAKKLLLHRFHSLSENGYFDYIRKYNLYMDSNQDDVVQMLRNGTLSIGFIGLWDAMMLLYDVDINKISCIQTYQERAIQIIQAMRNKTDEYSETENLNFSLLGSSAEGVSGFFPQYDVSHYDNAAIVCSKGYYTNSFHIPVQTVISCFEKIDMEAPFHSLCNGGHITYVELSELPYGNAAAIRELVDYAAVHDVGYFGINFPLDICNSCGEKGTFTQSCTHCGSMDIKHLRRVSGYLSDTQSFTQGKISELSSRIPHERNFISL